MKGPDDDSIESRNMLPE